MESDAMFLSRGVPPIPDPNTFIGGVGATSVTSAADLSSISTLTVGDISQFSIDGNNNVSCYIGIDYNLTSSAFASDTDITYYVDLGGYCYQIIGLTFNPSTIKTVVFTADPFDSINGGSDFRNQNLTGVNIPNFNVATARVLEGNSQVKYAYFPNFTSTGTSARALSLAGALRINVASCTIFRDTEDANSTFATVPSGCVIYVDPTMLTINAGDAQQSLKYARDTRGAVLVGVTNFTPPSAVTNLSASSITATGCDLDFTAPSSTNSLDFYEVWVENIDLDEWHKDRVAGRYIINQEITASGDTITGLTTSTNYRIWIVACDEFWNRSAISNVIEITTI